MQVKSQEILSAADLLSTYDGDPITRDPAFMSVAINDKEVIDFTNAMEDGTFISFQTGDITDKIDPRTRGWYKDAKAAGSGKAVFTSAYTNTNINRLVISGVAAYNGKDGNFRGVVGSDVSLDTLADRVKQLKYHGVGEGIIVDTNGLIIASSEGQAMHKVDENEVLKVRFPEMLEKKNGYFSMEKDGETQIIAYATVPSTGWIVGIAVPASVAFAQLVSLKMTYAVMSVVGIALVAGIILALLRFAATITGATDRLMHHVSALARGELHLPDLPVTSQDELGQLAANFNSMMKSIRDLIKQVAGTAEQLAAASEQLTAGAHQMAESATNIASTVASVAGGTDRQLESLAGAKKNIGIVSDDVARMSEKAGQVAAGSAAAADAAQRGEALMNDAMQKMTGIEQSVLHSADVVKKLGESSKQIGEIVETISAIAEQTNLLALRGFAVVAEEVRKLAEESRTAAEQIKERIMGVQRDTEEAVAAMQSGTSEVQAGTAAIHDVGTKFEDITRMVDTINAQMAEMSAAMNTVSKGMDDIVSSAVTINEISNETAEHMQTISSSSESQSASSEEIASASQSLATLATDLQNTTNKFRF